MVSEIRLFGFRKALFPPDIRLTKSHELLIRHTSGSIKCYGLPEWLY